MKRTLGACLLGFVLMAPVAIRADDRDHDRDERNQRREARDRHEWNEREDKAYRET